MQRKVPEVDNTATTEAEQATMYDETDKLDLESDTLLTLQTHQRTMKGWKTFHVLVMLETNHSIWTHGG